MRQLSAVSGRVTVNDYDEHSSAASAYGQMRVALARG